jgi:hypothetical protein
MPGGSPIIQKKPQRSHDEIVVVLKVCRPLFLLLPLFFTGCESVFETDLVNKGMVISQAGESPVVDLSQPKVMQKGDTVEISGTVTRKPGFDGPIQNGYVLVQLLDPKGGEIDELWSTWTPTDIPLDGSRQSAYDITYLWTPLPGTTVNALYGPTAEGINAGGKGGKGGPSASHAPPRSSSHHRSGGSFSSGMGFK